ncbi:MAG: GNAT family protein [Saprospiraceae bacterium]
MKFDHYSLRLFEANDADAFFHLIDRNRSRLEDFFSGTVARTRTLEDTRTYTAEIINRITSKTYFPYFLVDNHTQDFMGFFDVKNIDWNIPKGELGFFIDAAYENKGIAFIAFYHLVQNLIVEQGFNKLFLRTHPTNHAAIALAEKTGFVKEGQLRNDYRTIKGDLVDLAYYGLKREEFRNL